MRPSERIDRLERDLRLSRQEAMDLRVSLVECVEWLNTIGHVDLPAQEAIIHRALVALGVANPKPKAASDA